MRERLALRGFVIPDNGTAAATDESDLPNAAELDEAMVAEADRES
jgi:hypothetical protein